MSLVSEALSAAEQHPNRVFLGFDDEELTYRSLVERAGAIASGLSARGVGAGDRVASLLDNRPEAVLAWFAANWLGAIHVPLNTALRGAFLAHQLTDAAPGVLIVEADLLARVTEVLDDLPTPPQLIVVGADQVTYPTFTALEDFPGCEPEATDPGAVSVILYTSGTTGPSKGCMLSHAYLRHAGETVAWSIGREQHEVQWNCLPLFHMHAMSATVVATLLLRSTSVVARRFSLSGFWPAIEASSAVITYVIGPMAQLIASAEDTPASLRCRGQLRLVRGAPFPPDAAQVWRERFGVREVCVGGYGMTEAAPVVSMPPGSEGPSGAAGLPAPDFEVRVVDDDDQPLPAGDVGEVVVRPGKDHIMFEGYWGRPEATHQRWRNGWFYTGDLGRFDDQGYFYFVDRKRDSLRRRGENVSSFELETAIRQHPAVADIAVHAVPSPLTEDDIKATVVLKPGTAISEAALWRWLVDRIPDFARPRYVEFRPDLPRNAVGRVLKYQLREQGVTSATWDAEADDGASAATGKRPRAHR